MPNMYDNELWSYYTAIRKDDEVKSPQAQQAIREIVGLLIAYIDEANLLRYSNQKSKKDSIDSHLTNIENVLKDKEIFKELSNIFQQMYGINSRINESQSTPIIPSFEDIKAISYAEGLYHASQWRQFCPFGIGHPLDERIRTCKRKYNRLMKTGKLNYDDYDQEILSHIGCAFDWDCDMEQRKDSLRHMYEKSIEYINRNAMLLQLAEDRASINDHQFDELIHNLKKTAKDLDISWLTARWENSGLNRRNVRYISQLLRKQAQINGLMFKRLYYASCVLSQVPEPRDATESLYDSFLEDYSKDHTLRLQYTGSI